MPPGPSLPRRPAARRRMGVGAAASSLLGTPVVAVVSLQRHHPGLVLTVSVVELVALVLLVLTGSLSALVVLLLASAALVGVGTTNRRRVLALTGKGSVLLTASITGWPNGVSGTAERRISLPEPRGLGVSVELGGATWWVDRSSFRSLRRAVAIRAQQEREEQERQ